MQSPESHWWSQNAHPLTGLPHTQLLIGIAPPPPARGRARARPRRPPASPARPACVRGQHVRLHSGWVCEAAPHDDTPAFAVFLLRQATPVLEDDLLLMGTDGLFDNIFEQELLSIVDQRPAGTPCTLSNPLLRTRVLDQKDRVKPLAKSGYLRVLLTGEIGTPGIT